MSSHNSFEPNFGPVKPEDPALVPPAETAGTDSVPLPDSKSAAIDLIRHKLAAIYGDEPNARQEMVEAAVPGIRHSKHQQFMLSLHNSGRTASEIQTAWHQYYLSLSDEDKRQVWQEFYNQQPAAATAAGRPQTAGGTETQLSAGYPATGGMRNHDTSQIYPTPSAEIIGGRKQAAEAQDIVPEISPAGQAMGSVTASPMSNPLLAPANANDPVSATAQTYANDSRLPDTIRQQLRSTVEKRGKMRIRHHVQSVLFGLGVGTATLFVLLFGFFNEVVIAPFIQPSRTVSATPIIISPDGVTATDKNEVIIPKINVEIPLDFTPSTTDEKAFEAALNNGVTHYPTTALPGQKGNASFFGHSSNNIFNPGKYKFAFVLLNELVPGDSFYITYNHVAYAYTVYDKKIVEPTQVDILDPVAGKTATAMLVTCDPPGTSLHRLAVWGEQISPNPNSNSDATAPAASTGSSTALPGNGPTLWGRLRNWITQ